jgi:hypothetical protein
MTKKTETPVEEVKLQFFNFPTIGGGISVEAATFEEAQEMALKIQADLSK